MAEGGSGRCRQHLPPRHPPLHHAGHGRRTILRRRCRQRRRHAHTAAWRWRPSATRTRRRAWSLAQGHITHHHPLSDDASLTLVRMLHGLLSGGGKHAVREIADALIDRHRIFRFEPYQGQSSAMSSIRCRPCCISISVPIHFPIASSRPSIREETPTPRAHWRRCSPAPPMAWRRSPQAGSASSTEQWVGKFATKCRSCSPLLRVQYWRNHGQRHDANCARSVRS